MNTAWKKKQRKQEKSGKRNYNCGIRAEWINVNETKVQKKEIALFTLSYGGTKDARKTKANTIIHDVKVFTLKQGKKEKRKTFPAAWKCLF